MVSYDVNAYPGSEAPPTPPMDMCQIGYINPAGSGEAGGRPPGPDDPQRHRETYRGIQETCDVPGRHEQQGDNGCGGTCGRDYVPLTLPAAEQGTDQRTYAAGQHYQTFEQQGLREQIRSCDRLGCEDEDHPLGHAQDDPDPEGECGDGGDAPRRILPHLPQTAFLDPLVHGPLGHTVAVLGMFESPAELAARETEVGTARETRPAAGA